MGKACNDRWLIGPRRASSAASGVRSFPWHPDGSRRSAYRVGLVADARGPCGGVDAGKGPRRAEPDFGGKVVLGKGFQNPLVASVDCSGAPAPCFGCCRAEARHRICPCVYGVPAPGGWGASINSECHGLEGVKTMQSAPKQLPFLCLRDAGCGQGLVEGP